MNPDLSPCIEPGVDPLLVELRAPVDLLHAAEADPRTPALRSFVAAVFQRAHGAEVTRFHPSLLAFAQRGRVKAVLGYHAAAAGALFSEQYLEHPAHCVISRRLDLEVSRTELVEVGNFALARRGDARWVIAATTSFLAAAGYRWVLFTAISALANAFRRLGLKPLLLCAADQARLSDGGRAWGRYYEASPNVYAGDIQAGERKLFHCCRSQTPELRALLDRARELGRQCAGHSLDVAPTSVAS